MTKKTLRLTKDQKRRGVIFSSALIPFMSGTGIKVHEVFETDEDKDLKIERLLNDKFFNNSPYKYNLIRK